LERETGIEPATFSLLTDRLFRMQ